MFDASSFVVGGVSLIAVVFGLTEFVKSWLKWEGQKVTVLAASLGAVIMIVYQLISVIPAPYEQVVTIVFSSLAFGLSASGFYKYAADRIPKKE